MPKITGTIAMLLVFFSGFSQQTTLTAAEKASLDSMFKEDAFINMLKSAIKPKTYCVIGAGVGNSYFSTKNKQLNASQVKSSMVLTPSFAYLHKSGVGITATAFYANFDEYSGFYQYSLSLSYSIPKNKKIGSTVNFTHIFMPEANKTFASPIQNELYGNIYLKKPWLQPGVSAGLSGGRYTDYFTIDTVLNGIRRVFTDTAKTHITLFSLNAFVQHEFEYYNLLSKKDGVSIKPQVILNAGIQRFSVVHANPFFSRLKARNSSRFKNLGVSREKGSFTIQSVAFNLDVNYVIGKFGFQPQVYLDYYLPETSDQHFTTVYSFVVSYAF